ncbi:sensor histidine kinase [Kitasatospora sp. NPDC048540]|uniref:sensor histidine kinase n=1 Tax=unclassified Kitasatospora TaxID=2633591 RepID=UPI00053A7C37|nr:sensor histidine kinase [Kitasatospora sp. MBT63]
MNHLDSAPGPARSPETGVRHILFPYADERRFLSGTLSFVEHALEAGESVVVAVSGPREQSLREALVGAGTADRVSFLDTGELGGNPGRLIPMWQAWIGKVAQAGRPVRAISENRWPGRTEAETAELRYHEWLLNRAFADSPVWWLLCPFDTAAVAEGTLGALQRCHPFVLGQDGPEPATAFIEGPYAFEPLTDPCDPNEELTFVAGELASVRERITACAGRHGLTGDRLRDLLLAATEIAANSVKHAGGGTLRTWAADARVICEFRDTGYIDDPLAGRVRPTMDQIGGRGLWLVQQMCDLVQIRSSPDTGTVIRLTMAADGG